MNQKIIDVIKEVHEQWKGGSGSGNFGHSGRPGKHGGSAPGGGKGSSSSMSSKNFDLDKPLIITRNSYTYGKLTDSDVTKKKLNPEQKEIVQRIMDGDKVVLEQTMNTKGGQGANMYAKTTAYWKSDHTPIDTKKGALPSLEKAFIISGRENPEPIAVNAEGTRATYVTEYSISDFVSQ